VSVTGESYLELLSHWLIPELDYVGLLTSVGLQHDGAPAHYAADMSFPEQPISTVTGRHGPLIWPPRSPDPTTCDNWLWSLVKEQPSTICTYSVAELKGKIRYIFNTIKPAMACLEILTVYYKMLQIE
jgi:hypothetical protein